MRPRLLPAVALILLAFHLLPAASPSSTVHIPVSYYQLPNGLRVTLSADHTAPVVTVAVYYKIGFRVEPKDRTGFAHLFEHMMFQGSRNLGKMEFVRLVESNGGVLNGSTRFDFTNYFEILPSNKLETALWAEADRMRGLAITEENLTNQKGVVGNEVKVNVLNQPYGGFPWLDMPQVANTNFYNAHNFYGDLKDIEAATLQEVRAFFQTYYAPNNAVLVITGDFEEAQARQFVQQYFGPLPAQPQPPEADLTEPRQEKEKSSQRNDKYAKRPALAFAYHMPDRGTLEYWAMGLLDQLLLQGDDALLRQELVIKRGFTGKVEGGINVDLGNMFNYHGPMLWTASLVHDPGVSAAQIVQAVDGVIEPLRSHPVSDADLARAKVKFRSNFYSIIDTGSFGRADLLAAFALFDGRPDKINEVEPAMERVTAAIVQKAAEEYLRPGNRTVLQLTPGSPPPAAPAGTPATQGGSR